MALTDKLTAIADAIREKTGGTEVLTLDQMAAAISGLSTGGGGTDYGKLLYELPEPVYFDGESTFIETGVQILNETGEFTICLDFSSEVASGMGMLLHCMHEASPYNGMHLFTSVYSSYNNTWILTHYQKPISINITPYSTDRRRIVIRGNTNPSVNLSGGTVGDTYTGATVTAVPGYSYASFAPIEETVLIGAQRMTTGAFTNYWKGNLYDFKIFKRQISDSERDAYLNSGNML